MIRPTRAGQKDFAAWLALAAPLPDTLGRVVASLRFSLDAAEAAHRIVGSELERRATATPRACTAAETRARCVAEFVAMLTECERAIREVLPALAEVSEREEGD